MAKIIMTIEAVCLFLYYGFMSFIYGQINTSFMEGELGQWMVVFSVAFILITMFMPELMFVFSSSMRKLTLKHMEDDEGNLNKSTSAMYVSLWCMRLFFFMGISITLGAQIPVHVYVLPLVGTGALTGMVLLRNILGKS